MLNHTKTILILLIATSITHLLGMSTVFIHNKTTQDIEVIFKYEGHGKIEEVKTIFKENEKKEYAPFIPGCRLTSTTFSTIQNSTTKKQTIVIKNLYGNFEITLVENLLTVSPLNN